MTLYETLKPIVESTGLTGLVMTERPDCVDLDGVEILVEERVKNGLRGPHAQQVYIVSYCVGIAGTRDCPPDTDVVEVGEFSHPAEAVAAAIGVVIQQRIAMYMDRLADDEAARACQEDWSPGEG